MGVAEAPGVVIDKTTLEETGLTLPEVVIDQMVHVAVIGWNLHEAMTRLIQEIGQVNMGADKETVRLLLKGMCERNF